MKAAAVAIDESAETGKLGYDRLRAALDRLQSTTIQTNIRSNDLAPTCVHDIANYIVRGKVWEAFDSDVRPVLLIDEIDKADIEFPSVV